MIAESPLTVDEIKEAKKLYRYIDMWQREILEYEEIMAILISEKLVPEEEMEENGDGMLYIECKYMEMLNKHVSALQWERGLRSDVLEYLNIIVPNSSQLEHVDSITPDSDKCDLYLQIPMFSNRGYCEIYYIEMRAPYMMILTETEVVNE